jgi:hypothetical protein
VVVVTGMMSVTTWQTGSDAFTLLSWTDLATSIYVSRRSRQQKYLKQITVQGGHFLRHSFQAWESCVPSHWRAC